MNTHESTFYNQRDDQSPLAADPVLQGPNDRRCQMLGELQTEDVSAEERPIHELPKCGRKTDVLRSWSAN